MLGNLLMSTITLCACDTQVCVVIYRFLVWCLFRLSEAGLYRAQESCAQPERIASLLYKRKVEIHEFHIYREYGRN